MTLQIDYGKKRVVLKHSIWIGRDSTVDEKVHWCYESFKVDSWSYYWSTGSMYFKREEDLVLFTLRWS